jgi:hypothetical protein
MADFNVYSGGNIATVYCGYLSLHSLAAALGAAAHGTLDDKVEVETEPGVDHLGQPSGLITVALAAGGADITVDDGAGHSVWTWLHPDSCSRLSVAFAAASNEL